MLIESDTPGAFPVALFITEVNAASRGKNSRTLSCMHIFRLGFDPYHVLAYKNRLKKYCLGLVV